MGSTSFTRRAVLQSDGKYELKYRTSTGELRTQILEDKTAAGVSTIALEGVATQTIDLKKEDLSSSITSGKVAYTLTDNFTENSICIYLNGINVSGDITVTSSNAFTFSGDYSNSIATTDEILAVYVKA
jgi:hypothetical protein